VIFESFEQKVKQRAANFIVDSPFSTGCVTVCDMRRDMTALWVSIFMNLLLRTFCMQFIA